MTPEVTEGNNGYGGINGPTVPTMGLSSYNQDLHDQWYKRFWLYDALYITTNR